MDKGVRDVFVKISNVFKYDIYLVHNKYFIGGNNIMEHLINEEKISPSKYKVWNSSKDIEFIVDDEWLDSIPREGIDKLVMFNFGEKLEVIYKSGKIN